MPKVHSPHHSLLFAALVAAGSILGACDSLIYEEEDDCTATYRVAFRYTANTLNSDAFGAQVDEVNLALYDTDGNFVARKTAHRNLSVENDFLLDLDVAPGTYSLLAWCSGESTAASDPVSFRLTGTEPTDRLQMAGAQLPLSGTAEGLMSDHDINRFFHGLSENVVFQAGSGTHDVDTLYLIKDTNHISVALQNIDGSSLDPSLLRFSIEGANSTLDYENMPAGDIRFSYVPWRTTPLTADMENRAGVVNGVKAEFTTSRLMADREQYLTVTRTDNHTCILRLPLIRSLLLVKDNYTMATSDQDFLDREDSYALVLFVQDGYTWMNSRILINGWRIVPPQGGTV